MKIVIDIPNRLKEIADEYSKIDNKNLDELTYYRMNGKLALFCISKGTPLPKGHGRLGDLDALEKEMINGIKAGNYEEGYERYI